MENICGGGCSKKVSSTDVFCRTFGNIQSVFGHVSLFCMEGPNKESTLKNCFSRSIALKMKKIK